MTTQPSGDNRYEVIVWDFDAAPDAVEYFSEEYTEEEIADSILPYYCHRRYRILNLQDAIDSAYAAVEEKCFVGAAVFAGGKMVKGFGLVFPYRKRYL